VSRVAASTRQEREGGAATIEYVGIVIATSLLVVALIGMVPSAREQLICTAKQVNAPIVGGSNSGSCTVSGGGSSNKTEPPKPTKPPCVVRSDTEARDTSISIVVVELGGAVEMTKELLSDGTYRVTLVDKYKAGLSRSVNRGDIEGKVYGLLQGAVGKEYLMSADQVADFENWAMYEQFGRGWVAPEYQPPPANATYGELGAVIGGKGSVEGILSAEGKLGAAAGVRYDSNGNTTSYIKVTVDAQAATDTKIQAEGSGGGELVAAVTRDRSGRVIEVGLTSAISGKGGLNIAPLAGVELPQGDDATLSHEVLSAGGSAVMTMTIPVTDANRVQVESALYGLVVPGGQVPALAWLGYESATSGDFQTQTFTLVDSSGTKGGIESKDGFGFGKLLGFETSWSSASLVSTGVWDYNRDTGGWDTREECK